MSLLTSLRLRLAALRRRDTTEAEMEEELALHIEARAADLARRHGLPPDLALRRARLEFGSRHKFSEQCREALGTRMVEALAQDVRFGLRILRRSPGFTATAVLTLALGIGANAAILPLVNAMLFRPLPVHDPERLVVLGMRRGHGALTTGFSLADLRDLAAPTHSVFAALMGHQSAVEGLSVAGQARPILITFVTGGYFDGLGIKPYLGRFIQPTEGSRPGADPVLVLGYSYWRSRFGADPHIVGRTVAVNGVPVTVIGVAPEGFHGLYSLLDAQGYLPISLLTVEQWWRTHDYFSQRGLRNTPVMARLRPGVSLAQARAVLSVASRRLAAQFPADDEGLALQVFPERQSRPDPDPTQRTLKMAALFTLLAVLVLALACVNVANLLLARASVRQREMAVRAAHGAGRWRLIRQLMTEGLVLAIAGGSAGVVAGLWIGRALGAMDLGADLPIVLDLRLDWRILALSAAAVLICGLAVGVMPAWRLSSADLAKSFQAAGGGRTVAAGRSLWRSGLVAAEIGGSLMLLVVAGLFSRSLLATRHIELGFDPHDLYNLTFDTQELGYDRHQRDVFNQQLLGRVRALPGVESASLAAIVPMGYSASDDEIRLAGRPAPPGEPLPLALDNFVAPQYFRTLQIDLVAGRDFTAADDRGEPVAVINQEMARRFWPRENPLGRQFTYGTGTRTTARVIGISRDCHFLDLTGPVKPYFFAPLANGYISTETLHVRTRLPEEAIVRQVRGVLRDVAPALPLLDVKAMTQSLNTLQGLLVFRLGAALAAALGALGLLLAVVGVYGVIAYAAAQRTQEIGIRMALGAGRGDAQLLILRQGFGMVASGLAAGLAAAAGLARLVASLLVGVTATDPTTYLAVAAILAAVALLACYIPARRAARADPLTALRVG